jgi:hypothetical protein
LRDTRGFYDRRALLAVGKARGFFFVGVHAAKSLAVRVKHSNQPVMMLAAPVFVEGGLFVSRAAFGGAFSHDAFLSSSQ